MISVLSTDFPMPSDRKEEILSFFEGAISSFFRPPLDRKSSSGDGARRFHLMMYLSILRIPENFKNTEKNETEKRTETRVEVTTGDRQTSTTERVAGGL